MTLRLKARQIATRLAVAVGCEKDGFKITVSDNYVLSLSVGVEKLLSVQPEELKHDWKFTSVH